METKNCQIGWMNTLSDTVFKTYEEAYNDAKTDLFTKQYVDKLHVEIICKYVKLVFLWI